MGGTDHHRLAALGLLCTPERSSASTHSLAALCAAGALEGGLSVASDVRPDELVGPLCQRMGGEAALLRVVDARSAPPELFVRVGRCEAVWSVPDVSALVDCLNRCYWSASSVRAIAELGTLEDAHQLWCIPKPALKSLLREGLLAAKNVRALSTLEGSGGRQET